MISFNLTRGFTHRLNFVPPINSGDAAGEGSDIASQLQVDW